ncbi:MAG: hypothetical protein P4M00_18455 [Azospirillaceae bacterium]|nr:hypothetical protein [Azospirillaceae bacterium]
MNVIALSRGIDPDERLFQTLALNNIILFKYPNFNSVTDDDVNPIFDEGESLGVNRPVETGLYVPHTQDFPESGGVAIYLRSNNSENLLDEQFGLNAIGSESAVHDLKILSLIDRIPSLDAFLLKTCFEAEKIDVDPRYWTIKSEEDSQLRHLIRRRTEPIVRKAMAGAVGGSDSLERFLDAIWNPALEEAGLFVSAFGIERSEADAIFTAWKGTTFYEYQLRRIAPRVRIILTWLKSRDCIPVDIKMHKPFESQLFMHIERVGKLLDATMLDIRSIMLEYDSSFSAFMAGNPGPFRDYLRKVRSRYWLLGYCVSALTSIVHLDGRCMRNNPSRKLYFDTMQKLMRQFDVALDRRREQKGTL